MTLLRSFLAMTRRDRAERLKVAAERHERAAAALSDRQRARDTRGQHSAAVKLREALHARMREELSDG